MTQRPEPLPVVVAPARMVRICLAAALTGLTEKAIRRKIEDGAWAEGRHYHRRDGGVYIDLRGYERWVETGR
jgi:hypothetical protein